LDPPYDIKFVLVQKITLVLRKIAKTAATRAALLDSQYAPNRLSALALPQTPLGSLQRTPRPLAVFRGPTSKGKGGEKERRGDEGRAEVRSFALGRKKKSRSL